MLGIKASGIGRVADRGQTQHLAGVVVDDRHLAPVTDREETMLIAVNRHARR